MLTKWGTAKWWPFLTREWGLGSSKSWPLLTEEGRDVYEPPILADVICEQPLSKNTASKNFGIHSPSAHLLLGERILKVWCWKPHSKNRILSALRAEENFVLCKTPEKGSLFQLLSFSQWLGEKQPNVYCEDFGQKGLTTMYQLLGPLSTSKENVLTSRCHVSQLFSQWAISTGEKGPKNYWGIFLTST